MGVMNIRQRLFNANAGRAARTRKFYLTHKTPLLQ
jgi:hypothetical protein